MFLGSSCCNIAENSTFARPLDFACRLNPSFHAFAEACATETLGIYESLELVEVKPLQTDARNGSGIRLLVDGIEIAIEKGFDGTTLSEVLNLLKARSCSASAVR